jgi:hypothetical protein
MLQLVDLVAPAQALWDGAREAALRLCPSVMSRLVMRTILMMVHGMDMRLERHGADTIAALHAAVQRMYTTASSPDEYRRGVAQLPELVRALLQLETQRSRRATAPAGHGHALLDGLRVTGDSGPLGLAVEALAVVGPAGECVIHSL